MRCPIPPGPARIPTHSHADERADVECVASRGGAHMWWGVGFTVAAMACTVVWVLMNSSPAGRRRPHGDKRQAPPVSGSGGDGWKSRP